MAILKGRAFLGVPALDSILLSSRSRRLSSCKINSTAKANTFQAPSAEDISQLLQRHWLFPSPAVKVQTLHLSTPGQQESEILVVRDDLLHPLVGGNKVRKLDGMLPPLKDAGVTHVVTCGGLQSSHTAAIACACAENGMHAHLVIRGEQPSTPTGYHLYARLYGTVEYVTRAEYTKRQNVLQDSARRLQDTLPYSAKVHVIPEGAANADAMLGFIRLINWLSQPSVLGRTPCNLIIDSGTGITATGLGLGIKLLGLPWRVTAVSLVESPEQCLVIQRWLTAAFCEQHLPDHLAGHSGDYQDLPISWVERMEPRRFGKVLRGEIAACRQVARQCGILIDPIYNLSAWTAALQEVLGDNGDSAGVSEAEMMKATSFKAGTAIEPIPVSPLGSLDQHQSLKPHQNGSGPAAENGNFAEHMQSSTASDVDSSSGSSSSTDTAGQTSDQLEEQQRQNIHNGSAQNARHAAEAAGTAGERTVILHTGGSLGLCGLAQRFPEDF